MSQSTQGNVSASGPNGNQAIFALVQVPKQIQPALASGFRNTSPDCDLGWRTNTFGVPDLYPSTPVSHCWPHIHPNQAAFTDPLYALATDNPTYFHQDRTQNEALFAPNARDNDIETSLGTMPQDWLSLLSPTTSESKLAAVDQRDVSVRANTVSHVQDDSNFLNDYLVTVDEGGHAPRDKTRLVGSQQIKVEAESRRRRAPAFACVHPNCGGHFTSLANGKRHVLAHYDIKMFVCKCGAKLTTAYDLTRHIANRQDGAHAKAPHLLPHQDKIKAKEAIAKYLRRILECGELTPLEDVHPF